MVAESTCVANREPITIASGQAELNLRETPFGRGEKTDSLQLEAYQLYLKGRYLSNQSTVEGLKKSIEYFQQAIDKDPGYAMAYVGLADSYNWLGG
jgi:hypothetical protein